MSEAKQLTETAEKVMTLTGTARRLALLRDELKAHEKVAKERTEQLRQEIGEARLVLRMAQEGLDQEKVNLAQHVIRAGDPEEWGSDGESCRQDAIRQLSTGKPIGAYTNLWNEQFATKNYDRWRGQRSDCKYGYGPRHGSICFSIGFTPEVRRRNPRELTPEETEAAIYYLVNLERIKAAEKATKGDPR